VDWGFLKVDVENASVPDPGKARIWVGLHSFFLALNPFNFEAYLQRGRAYARLKERQKAIADYNMALSLMPPNNKRRGEALFRRSNNYRDLKDLAKAYADVQTIAELDLELPFLMQAYAAEDCNELAWRYVTGPEKERDPKKALPMAQKAVKLMPEACLNTLGVVYYRLGRYAEAMKTLEQSLRVTREKAAAFDLFFLAMCHAQLGEAAKAKECYDRAVHWVQEQQGKMRTGWKEELDAFRSEAETLLQARGQISKK
jgi:tetratricopeptide (TPR) repeat protein